MSAARQEVRAAWRRLTGTPGAMFLAVLTAGFALTSTAQHMGLYNAGSARVRQCKVVLACPRSNAAKSAAAGAHASGSPAGQTSPAVAPAAGAPAVPQNGTSAAEKHAGGKTGGSGFSVPLPDFNAPELSRFISPL